MANIYKIKKDNKLSKKTYTLKGARQVRKDYESKNIEVEIVVYKTDVKILDFLPDTEVKFYTE